MKFKSNIDLKTGQSNKTVRFLPYTSKSISRIRQDVKSWNNYLAIAQSEEPKMWPLQLLFNDIFLDAHLASQIENRKQQVFSAGFSLKTAKGEVDEEQTKFLSNLKSYRDLTNQILDSIYFGYSLVELNLNKTDFGDRLDVISLPRTNIVPQLGRFLTDYSDDSKFIIYREMPEFGTWILEFNTGGLGLLNKAVPNVLFKRFAQSCWSELCEIYGIPPRVLTTNTQDTVLLNRAEQMMKDMGAAAWFIIDETEKFEWAQGVSTNGDVYNNLITLCRNEISLLISGAVIGQDTVNGNRSKEEVSQDMLWQLVQSDMKMVESYWNSTIIPALIKIGILKGEVHFEFDPSEDLDQLFKFTQGLLPFKEIDNNWLKEKFGVEVTGDKSPLSNGLKADNDFFV